MEYKTKTISNSEMFGKLRISVLCNGHKFTSQLQLYRYMKKSGYKSVFKNNVSYYGDVSRYQETVYIDDLKSEIKNAFSKRFYTIAITHTQHGQVKFLQCDDCGNWFDPEDNSYINVDDRIVCEDCSNDYIQCDHCGEWAYSDDVIAARDTNNNEIYICSTCARADFTQCADGTYRPDGEVVNVSGYNYWVDDDDLHICSSCNSYIYGDDAIWQDDEVYCDSCYNEISAIVHEYNYKPEPDFFGKGEIFAGVEIEVNTNDVERLHDGIDSEIFYLKHDSSLSSDGVEIVSHPCTLDFWQQLDFNFLDLCRGWHDGYGIHVHISRKGFKDQFHIEKVVNFFAKNPEFIENVAQRKSERWAKIQTKVKKSSKTERYQAINQKNKNTIEFRIFQSSSRKDRILKNIEFCFACVEFCKQPYLITELTESNFRAFLKDNKGKYSELYNYLFVEFKDGNFKIKK